MSVMYICNHCMKGDHEKCGEMRCVCDIGNCFVDQRINAYGELKE